MKYCKVLILCLISAISLGNPCKVYAEHEIFKQDFAKFYKVNDYDKLRNKNYFDTHPMYNISALNLYKISLKQLNTDPYFYQSCYGSQVQQQLITLFIFLMKDRQLNVFGNSISFFKNGTWNIYAINKVNKQFWNRKTNTLTCNFSISLSVDEKIYFKNLNLSIKHVNSNSLSSNVKLSITVK